ncbi:MAG: TetR/AcrR family transcriptional regulator C-terminal domain-containing protein [Treponema sp.]|nr:TetR/AcrR family transcriptional regulator C-terminal domain-containing protein [Treponema sp.]
MQQQKSAASTKDRIADTFLALTEQKAVNKITVREIAEASGVTAVTFYNYFRDKYDLIVWIHVRAASEIMGKIGGGYKWRDTLLDGIRYFSENRAFMLNALCHTSGQDSFIRHVERVNTELLTAEVKNSLGAKPVPPAVQYAIKVYCSGTVRAMFDCLMDEMPISAEELAQIFEDCLPPILRGFLYP